MGRAAATGISPLLRRPEVERLTGLRKTAIYDGMKAGTFPKRVKLTTRCVGWPEHEIAEWIASRQRL
jgi:prophage regulatory protein